MSYYVDFLNDLPKRIKKLLDRHYFEEKHVYIDSYEVTLLISLSMPVLTTSVQLIRNDSFKKETEINLKSKINSAKEDLLHRISENWECGKIKNNFELNDLELKIIECKKSVRNSEKEIFTFLSEIRNGLSHAGIRFLKGKNDEINLILFRSAISMDNLDNGYNIQIIPVEDYKQLIKNLCNVLIKQNLNLFDLSSSLENENIIQKTGTND